MSYIQLDIASPTLSAYDPDNPTQATEELNLALHKTLADMDSALWYLTDGRPSASNTLALRQETRTMIKVVFDYAKAAIVNYEDHGTPDLTEPVYTLLPAWTLLAEPRLLAHFEKLNIECMKKLYWIYYLWETESDPMRIKGYIRDMLMAWPLQDIAIDLNDETGTSLKIYPQWKNLET